MAFVQSVNLGLRFLLELAALTALGFWGFQTGNDLGLKWLLAIGAPLAAAVIWGAFGSPGAPYPVQGFYRTLLELFIIATAASAIFFTKHYGLAGIYTSVALANLVLLHVWKQ